MVSVDVSRGGLAVDVAVKTVARIVGAGRLVNSSRHWCLCLFLYCGIGSPRCREERVSTAVATCRTPSHCLCTHRDAALDDSVDESANCARLSCFCSSTSNQLPLSVNYFEVLILQYEVLLEPNNIEL